MTATLSIIGPPGPSLKTRASGESPPLIGDANPTEERIIMRMAGKQHKTDWRCRLRNWRRRGAAVVEMAVVSPVLLLTAMGIVDVGQYVSIAQIVNNASREGARVAIRSDTDSVSEVEATILADMTDAFSGVLPDTINSALQVSVTDEYGTISGGDLTLVDSGSEISVTVTFNYQSIRWAPSGFFGADSGIEAETIMRRD